MKISNSCTGCGLCKYICKREAIYLALNEVGEKIAYIDETKCSNCGMCKKYCPEHISPTLNEPKECYAAWNKDAIDYQSTSSGGLATLLSKHVINCEGVVYGATMKNDGCVEHIRIDDIAQLENIKGSKYASSIIVDCFKMVKHDIEEGRKVLFIGTPCQTAAMTKVFSSYDNFFAVDLICHGTPPNIYFQEYLSSFNFEPSDDIKVTFRNKRYWLTIKKNGMTVYHKRYNKDPYFYAFMYNLIFRENCYGCQYSQSKRCSDITLGDFWGLNRDNKEIPEFVSCLLLNSKKGIKLFDGVKDLCMYEEREVSEAIAGNDNLKHPSIRPKEKDIFNSYYEKGGFENGLKHASVYKKIRMNYFYDFVLMPYRILKYGFRYRELL